MCHLSEAIFVNQVNDISKELVRFWLSRQFSSGGNVSELFVFASSLYFMPRFCHGMKSVIDFTTQKPTLQMFRNVKQG